MDPATAELLRRAEALVRSGAATAYDPVRELLSCPGHHDGHCIHWWEADDECCFCDIQKTRRDEREFAVAAMQSRFRRL
jgi:hypothetical protein